jgi:hypothetical protein
MENQPFNSIYNNFGIATGLTSLGSYSIPSLSTIYNSVSDPTAPQSLGSGYFSNDIYSANYVQGQNGWKLFYNGNFEANNGTFRGNITATSGTIGGWTIGATTLTGGTVTLDSSGLISGGTIRGTVIETAASGNYRLLMGETFGSYSNASLVWISSGNSLLGATSTDTSGNAFLIGTTSVSLALNVPMISAIYNATQNYIVLNLPTSSANIPSGALWNNGGVVTVKP